MSDFHDRLPYLIERRKISSAEVSRRMGRKPSYISNLLREEADPKLSTLQQLSTILDCSMDELTCLGPLYSVEAAENGADRLTTQIATLFHRTVNDEMSRIDHANGNSLLDKVAEFWLEQGGLLNEGSQFSEFVDTYHAPTGENGRVKLHKMGRMSAAAETLGLSSTQQLNREIDKLPVDISEALASAQRLSLEERRPIFDIVKLDLQTADGPIAVIYRRLYTPWKDASGREYVVNASQRVSVKVKNPELVDAAAKPSVPGHR